MMTPAESRPDAIADRRTARRRHGDDAEKLVARLLVERGWTMLAAGVRVGRDEVDLLAVEPGHPPVLVFVEVRSRSSDHFGAPEETIGAGKIARTYRAAFALLRGGRLADGRPLPRVRWRVDLITVDRRAARWIEGAGPLVRHLRDVRPD